MTQDLTYILNKGMKVFSQLYVGIRNGKNPLGFATPFEDNAAGRKRQATVLNWAGFQTTPKIVDNIPRSGFKVTDDVKRVYWGGGNVVWRIADPYGYELEIQSANLLALIQTAGILPGGEINGKCLWGRSGSDNILIHESSEEYKTAILAAETLKKPTTISKESRTVGATYLLMDGSTGIYLGKFWVAKSVSDELVNGMDLDFEIKSARAPGFSISAQPDHHVLCDISEFDAVLYIGNSVKLYKKAPLVKEDSSAAVLTEEQIIEIAESARLTYASSAIKGRPEIITRHKPEVFWKLCPLTPGEIIEKFKYWSQQEDSYKRLMRYNEENKNNPHFTPQRWSMEMNNRIISMYYRTVIVDAGKMYGDAFFRQSRGGFDRSAGNFAGEIVINENTLTSYNLNSRYLRNGPKFTRTNSPVEVGCFTFPDFTSPDEAKEWIIAAMQMHRIMKVVPAYR